MLYKQLINNGPGVLIKRITLERARSVVIFDERVNGLNYENDVILRRYV